MKLQAKGCYSGLPLYLDEHSDEWAHPTDIVTGYSELARVGRMRDDADYVLRMAQTKSLGTSGLTAMHTRTGQVSKDMRLVASLIIGRNCDEKRMAKKLLRSISVSRHGVLYRAAGRRLGHMRIDRKTAQVQFRYIKLQPGRITWSAELCTISGLPFLTPVLSVNKLSPWMKLESLSQCEDGTNGFQPHVAFLLMLNEVDPWFLQLKATDISCGWPTLHEAMVDESRNSISADATITCRTSSVMKCHRGHKMVSHEKYHVKYAGLWNGEDYCFENWKARIGFKQVTGIDELYRKGVEEEDKMSVSHVYSSWSKIASVNRLIDVQEISRQLSTLAEDDLRKIRRFYSNLWEPLNGIRLELSDEEVFIDLSIATAAVMHSTGIKGMGGLLAEFIRLIEQEWIKVAKENMAFPCRMAAPYLPGLLLNKERKTYYIFGTSFSWEEKSRVDRKNDTIIILGSFSRVYKDGLVVGDLDGSKWTLNSAEMSLLSNGEIGWITEFASDIETYRVVEVDLISAEKHDPDPKFRRVVAEKTRRQEPRISSVRKDDTEWVRKCLPIALLLLSAQRRVSEAGGLEPLRHYDDVKQEILQELESKKLNSIDLAYFHLAMGSYTSRNKIWSARALAEHKRVWSMLRNTKAPSPVEWRDTRIQSRLRYSDREAVFVRARRPWDTIAVLVITISAGAWMLIDATNKGRDFYDLGTLLTAVLGTVTGLTGLYHAIRYRGWALGDAVRAYRRCQTVEEMRTVMRLEEVHKTLLDAGESGRFTDGIKTCAYSDHSDGAFAVARGLQAEMFERCGGRLGLDSEGDDVVIYGNRIRKVDTFPDGRVHVTSRHGVYPVVKASRLNGTVMEGMADFNRDSAV